MGNRYAASSVALPRNSHFDPTHTDYDTVTLPTKLLLDALRDKAAVLEFGPNKARG